MNGFVEGSLQPVPQGAFATRRALSIMRALLSRFASAGIFICPALAVGADPAIDVKLPYGITYDFSPVQVEVITKGGDNLSYHIFDAFKRDIARGPLKPSGAHAITFTPPRYGWYVIECGTYEKDHMTSGAAKFIGVTPNYPNMPKLAKGESRGGWNDEAMQAFSGLPTDRTNTRMGWANADRVLKDAQKYGVTLIMQFESAPNLDHVRDAVTRLKGRVKYWELVNEPNLSMSPEAYAVLLKNVSPAIKQIDPDALVLGPGTCGIHPEWIDAIYRSGAGKYLDAISLHDYEGNESIDVFHWNHQMGQLRKLMAENGDASKPVWQTERAIPALRQGFCGATQALRLSLERDIMEAWGVTNNHNNHYYVSVTGYNQVPSFVISESGPHPAALVCRTRAAMIDGKRYVGKIDFGVTGNKMFLGLLYQTGTHTTITLRNIGCLDIPMEVNVSDGAALEVADAFGNTMSLPVRSGKAVITMSQWPCYVLLASGQRVTFPPWDFGNNIAGEATYTYSGGTSCESKLLTDGLFQSNYTNPDPWGTEWTGSYPGKFFNDQPQTFDIAFPKSHTIDKLLIYGAHADNPYSALLDYDLQYYDGQQWVTLEKVRTPCPASDVASTYAMDRMPVMWYQDNNFFVHQFKKPVTTDKFRMVVRRITRGCIADMIAEDALNRWAGTTAKNHWSASSCLLELREIEIYEAPGMEPKDLSDSK